MAAAGDTLFGTVVVIDGSLDVQDGAFVAGNAWVINGDLILTGSAAVGGDAILVNGSAYASRSSRIDGSTRLYACECRLDDRAFESEGRVLFVTERDPRIVRLRPAIAPGAPCRADYSVLHVGVSRENALHAEPYIRVRAMIHVPIWKESHGHLGFSADISAPLRGNRVSLLLRGFKMTWTEDDWQLSRLENAVAVALTGDDFADYYERRGAGVGVRVSATEVLEIESMVFFQRDLSLEAVAIPSLFRSADSYRVNPPIDDGERFFTTLRIVLDTREDEYRPGDEWLLSLELEKGFADGPGDFSYLAFELDARRYNKLAAGFQLDIGGKLFSSFDPIPRQLTQYANGYGGIRGASDDPFPVHRGNRLIVLSAELAKRLPDIRILRSVFTRWSALAFYDAGLLVLEDQERRPFEFLREPFDRWQKSIGLGIAAESFLPYIGIYVAQDLDRDEFEPRFILRARRSF